MEKQANRGTRMENNVTTGDAINGSAAVWPEARSDRAMNTSCRIEIPPKAASQIRKPAAMIPADRSEVQRRREKSSNSRTTAAAQSRTIGSAKAGCRTPNSGRSQPAERSRDGSA